MNKKNILIMVLAMVLVAVVSVGGTMAWLTDTTTEVKNTFTPAGIDITLEETLQSDGTELETNEAWSAHLVPGVEYTKNPVVTVVTPTTDVPVYLFVKVDEGNCENYLDYQLAWDVANSGWTELVADDVAADTVYYREVAPTDPTKSWNLIVDDKVTVKTNLVKAGEIVEGKVEMPSGDQTMTFTAYAIQTAGFEDDVAGAWAAIFGN